MGLFNENRLLGEPDYPNQNPLSISDLIKNLAEKKSDSLSLNDLYPEPAGSTSQFISNISSQKPFGGIGLDDTYPLKISQSLASIVKKLEIDKRGQYFLNKVVIIDGFRFIGCRFDGCTLKSSTGKFHFEKCVISPDCKLELIGDAKRIATLNNLLKSGEQVTKHEDGTFSII